MSSSAEQLKAIIDLVARNEVQRAYEQIRQYRAESKASLQEDAQSLIRGLRHAYQHFAVTPVHIFLRGAPEALGPELGNLLRDGLNAQLQKTDEWRETLKALGRERYARETRSLIRAKRLKEAAIRVRAMIELSREDENPKSIVGYLGTTLGTLDHDQDQVDQLISALSKAPERFGMTSELAEALDMSRKQQFARSKSIALEGREREFNRVITQAIVDLRNRFSTDLATGEPTPQETQQLFEELHAMFRAYYVIGRSDGLLDVISLLVELTPRDRRAIGPVVASEERLFLSLNPRQKLICARSMRRLGEIPRLVNLIAKFSRSPEAEGYRISIIEVMGGIGSPEFYDFIVRFWQDSDFQDPRFSCIDALGRIQKEAASELLIKRFGTLLRARPFDPPKRREAEAICTALGRVSRSKGVSIERRNEITAQVVSFIPPSDTQMGFRAARDLFSFQAAQLDQRLIDWAMERIVQALWSQEQRPEFARSVEGNRAVLGFRQEIVDVAIQIGSRGLEAFLQGVEPNATRFSGALFAVAEILEKIGNETALPVLKKLIITAWMSSEDNGSKYYQETYFDPATATVKPMTRDKIIHALLYTVGQIGGAEGRRYLVETANQVRSKELDMPGDATGAFLMQQIVDHGREVAEERFRTEAATTQEGSADVEAPYARLHITDVMGMLRARYLTANAKRAKKIPAIQEIARRRSVEALDALVEQLGEKEPLIQAAAVTAIKEFSAPGARQTTLKALGQILLDRLSQTRADERAMVGQVLQKINPRREPFRNMIVEAYEQAAEGSPLKGELSRVIRAEGLYGAEGIGKGDAESEAEALNLAAQRKAQGEQKENPPEEENLSIFELRRRYFLARKAWVNGGKKGDPPVPPEGL